MGKRFDNRNISIATEHLTVSKLYGFAVKDAIGVRAAFSEQKAPRGALLYTVELNRQEEADRLLRSFEHTEERFNRTLMSEENFPMFFSGAFMACGTVSEPVKSYHLELLPPDDALADMLFEQLSTVGYPPKSTVRRGQTVLYFKESEQIEDLLTLIGATRCSLELMETKIYKDLRNRANRAANCDAANAGKLFKAAAQQLSDIELLRAHNLLETLPPQTVAVARLREENNEASLSELSKLSGLSRSGINHRFNQLAQAAQQLRDKGEAV
ncbi:MAG TPA: DNA-binding protein WhiA [Clostridia bacterium]|nr:DNA-binding protein WhiA [Clostridia bacterium]